MRRSVLSQPAVIIAVLVLQVAPLLLLPASSYSPTGQEWWLPALLTAMVLIADVQVILRRSVTDWPWHLMGFAQGFNIISRLMMLWPNATRFVGQDIVPNWSYLLLTSASMLLSALALWFVEKPQVRTGLATLR